MLNENAKKWVKALRSGEYNQCTSQLQDHKGYCCLGVACAVYEKETGNELYKENGQYNSGNLTDSYQEVKKWLGLNTSIGSYKGGNLAALNDIENYTFKQIADVIESEPEGLFL